MSEDSEYIPLGFWNPVDQGRQVAAKVEGPLCTKKEFSHSILNLVQRNKNRVVARGSVRQREILPPNLEDGLI